jgi:endonuclease YncB( thermonuclease family)
MSNATKSAFSYNQRVKLAMRAGKTKDAIVVKDDGGDTVVVRYEGGTPYRVLREYVRVK